MFEADIRRFSANVEHNGLLNGVGNGTKIENPLS